MSVALETFGTVALSDRSLTLLREALSEVVEIDEVDPERAAMLEELHSLGG